MTKNKLGHHNQDISESMAQISMADEQQEVRSSENSNTKSPQGSALLAQQLASESSWADRYVSSTPSGTIMTPSSPSVAEHGEYVTSDEAPPAYEIATSTASEPGLVPVAPQLSHGSQAQAQPRTLSPESSQPRQHEILPPFRSSLQQGQESGPFRPGKHYERHETSNSITGTFTLHDSLDLSTKSGSISITLDVKPGPNPAILKLKTKSGGINVSDSQCNAALASCGPRFGPWGGARPGPRGPSSPGPLSFLFGWGRRQLEVAEPPVPTSDDPRKQPGQLNETERQQNIPVAEDETEPEGAVIRVIHATIEASSGSVSAHLVLTAGSETRITTGSGSIGLRMVTAGFGSRTLSKQEQEDSRLEERSKSMGSILSTQSGSASQNISIMTSGADSTAGGIVSACQAKYYATGSGSINVHYPKDWTGLVHASCGGSGHVFAHGHGLEYDKRGNREVYAWRGVDEPDLLKAVVLRCDGSSNIGFTC